MNLGEAAGPLQLEGFITTGTDSNTWVITENRACYLSNQETFVIWDITTGKRLKSIYLPKVWRGGNRSIQGNYLLKFVKKANGIVLGINVLNLETGKKITIHHPYQLECYKTKGNYIIYE